MIIPTILLIYIGVGVLFYTALLAFNFKYKWYTLKDFQEDHNWKCPSAIVFAIIFLLILWPLLFACVICYSMGKLVKFVAPSIFPQESSSCLPIKLNRGNKIN